MTQPYRGSAPDEVVIGIDVGTTAAKVSGFGLNSGWRHTAVNEYPLLQPRPGWEVQDPRVMWLAVRAGLTEVALALQSAHVVGMSLSTAMHGLIGLDEQRKPTTPLLTWADSRAAEQALRLKASGKGRRLHRTSGTPVHSMSALTKLIWFSENEPDVCARTRWWIGLKDYMILHLTGELATELSCASGTGMLDMATRDWNPEAIDIAGVRVAQLPPILPTTHALTLRTKIADKVGLPAGTPVVMGAGDGPLGNLGVGALTPGVVGLSLGTSGAIRMITDKPYVDDRGKLFCYALTDDHWVIGGAVSNGGIVVRWAGDVFAEDLQLAQGESRDARLLELAAGVDPGCDGLAMLPFLMAERAPLWNPTIPGAFLGVRRHHTRAHFVRSAVEGVALALSTIATELDRVVPIQQVRATGGVFRSTLWRDIVAAAIGKPFVVTGGADGTTMGAAALCLYGLGRASSLAEGLSMVGAVTDASEEIHVPPAELVSTYRGVRASIPKALARYDDVAALYADPAEPTP